MSAKKPSKALMKAALKVDPEHDTEGARLMRSAWVKTTKPRQKTRKALSDAGCPASATTIYRWAYKGYVPYAPQSAVIENLWGVPPASWGQKPKEVEG